jgi:hypothetical protein
MPAGNDATAAAAELADQFGKGGGSADALIKSSRSRYEGDLGAAQLKVAEDVEVDLDKVAKAAGVKSVASATVRGDSVVYVHEDADGRLVKGVVGRDSLDSKSTPSLPKPKKADKDEK